MLGDFGLTGSLIYAVLAFSSGLDRDKIYYFKEYIDSREAEEYVSKMSAVRSRILGNKTFQKLKMESWKIY